MSGDRLVLRELLVSHYGRLHRRLSRRFGCPDMASDCLHDTWLRLEDACLPDDVRSPEAYVFRMACNVVTDHLRKQRPWYHDSDGEAALEHAIDPAPGPDEVTALRASVAALDNALATMPPRHRRILVSLRLEELTRQELAGLYRISVRSVDTALRQALDHCAALTGRPVSGGISASRRALAHA